MHERHPKKSPVPLQRTRTPIILDTYYEQELYMFGVIPISLVHDLEEARRPDQPYDYQNRDWKSKEQAAEDFLFHVETLATDETARLNLYADSFVQFVEKNFL